MILTSLCSHTEACTDVATATFTPSYALQAIRGLNLLPLCAGVLPLPAYQQEALCWFVVDQPRQARQDGQQGDRNSAARQLPAGQECDHHQFGEAAHPAGRGGRQGVCEEQHYRSANEQARPVTAGHHKGKVSQWSSLGLIPKPMGR